MSMRISKCFVDEVEPFILKSHHQTRPSFIKLETIIEYERQEPNSFSKNIFVSFPFIILWNVIHYVVQKSGLSWCSMKQM